MELATIKEVKPRDVWANEATEFTPWLAKETSLALLSDVVSMNLELVSREEKMDGGRADLVCIDSDTQRRVIIENQLEKTDPDHLGRILSYASALDANTVIWIATEFDEQYRATLDWLNRATSEDFNFFGIEIHCLQIDDSKPAPQFKVIVSPNGWQKQVKASQRNDEQLTETKILQQEYWQGFIDFMKANPSKQFHTQKALPQHWMNIAIGRSGFKLSITVNSVKNELSVQFVIDDDMDKAIFDKIEAEYKEKSLAAISPELDWRRLDGKKVSITLLANAFNFKDKATRNEQYAWFKETCGTLIKFFQPIVKAL